MTIETLREKGLIILESIAGSKAYGLDTPTSDTDIRGVFVLPEEDFFGLDHTEQVADDGNDVVFYELRKFVDLLLKNNPNILELLAMPEDCLIYRHPMLNLLKPEEILSRICKDSFAGYAKAQIRKARGLNKKILNPMEERRKGILEFCWVVEGQGSVLVEEWLSERGWRQEDCGLVNVPHMVNVYALFHGGENAWKRLGFKGIAQKPTSNNISLSPVPKEMEPVAVMSFNKDGYTRYCKDYKAYWDWVGKRNEARYENTISHGKNYDSKNMMHTFRLLDMAEEIAREGKVIVRRPNRDFLLGIKKGEYDYDELLEIAEGKLSNMDALYEESALPEAPDPDLLNSILIKMRRRFYAEFSEKSRG